MFDLSTLVQACALGDPRRDARFFDLVENILQGQAAGTHGTQGTGQRAPWPHVMAAWRFFKNDDLPLPALYAPCVAGLRALVPEGACAYVVHDLSPVDFSLHNAKKDRVRIGNGRGRGYELYTPLVLDAAGRPLGPLGAELRTADGLLSSFDDAPLTPDGHHAQVERGVLAAHLLLPGRELVNLFDAEFDDVRLLRFLTTKRGRYVGRAAYLARRVLGPSGERTTLGEAADAVTLRFVRHETRQGEDYALWVGETHVTFDGASFRGVKAGGRPQPGPPIRVRVVVSELRPEGGGTPLRWVLLTDVEDESATWVVQRYLWRWHIERFFFLTKAGFRLEQWRQQTGERVARRLAVSSLAAMALYQLQASETAEAKEAVAKVAELGGFLPLKNRTPGPLVLMRGMALVIGLLRVLQWKTYDEVVALVEGAGAGWALPGRMREAVAARERSRARAHRAPL